MPRNLLLSFLFITFCLSAQKYEPLVIFPIPKETLLRFKTYEEALGLPASYRLLSGSVCFKNKGAIIDSQNFCPIITQGLSSSVPGDTIIFSASVLSEKSKTKTIFMTKAYVLK